MSLCQRLDNNCFTLREVFRVRGFMRHASQLVTPSPLMAAAWECDFEPRGTAIDLQIHRIGGTWIMDSRGR
jgi:DNA-binding response OmpR family regulator